LSLQLEEREKEVTCLYQSADRIGRGKGNFFTAQGKKGEEGNRKEKMGRGKGRGKKARDSLEEGGKKKLVSFGCEKLDVNKKEKEGGGEKEKGKDSQ